MKKIPKSNLTINVALRCDTIQPCHEKCIHTQTFYKTYSQLTLTYIDPYMVCIMSRKIGKCLLPT